MNMHGKTVVITGASDGIGLIAARELSKQGARVIGIGRTPEKTKQVAAELGITFHIADFANLHAVRELAAVLRSEAPHIDVLINNAGGIFGKRELTVDGYEKTLQVNHLAHFLLTNLLLDLLCKSGSIVINTSSIANSRYGNIDIGDLNLEHAYSPNHAYGNAKLANIMFTHELHRRYHDQGINTAAVHPGIIATNFANSTTSFFRYIYRTPFARMFLDTPEQGAKPLIHIASTTPGVDWESGNYYEKFKLGTENNQALDETFVRAFWDRSAELVELS